MTRTIKIILLSLFLISCASTEFGEREKGALTGAAIGSGLGAIIGNQTGRAGEGVAIGAGIGAITGGLIGNSQRNSNMRQQEQEERLRRNELELERQRRELEEYRRRNGDYDSNSTYSRPDDSRGSSYDRENYRYDNAY